GHVFVAPSVPMEAPTSTPGGHTADAPATVTPTTDGPTTENRVPIRRPHAPVAEQAHRPAPVPAPAPPPQQPPAPPHRTTRHPSPRARAAPPTRPCPCA